MWYIIGKYWFLNQSLTKTFLYTLNNETNIETAGLHLYKSFFNFVSKSLECCGYSFGLGPNTSLYLVTVDTTL